MEIEPINANDFNKFVTTMKEVVDAEGVVNIDSEDPLADYKEGYTSGLSRFRGYELKASSPLEVDVENAAWALYHHRNVYPLVMELPDQLPIIHVKLCREAAIPPKAH